MGNEHGKQNKKPSSWMQRWARLGYYTRGLVFTLVGVLAGQVAVGWGITPEGTHGALRAIGRQPFGRALLAMTTVGLTGYVTWRFMQALYDPGFEAHGMQRVMRRVAFSVSGCFYALMAITAAELTLGARSQAQSHRDAWTAWALRLPLGRVLVITMGLVLVGVGVHAFYRVYVKQFMQLYRLDTMSKAERRTARVAGRIGLSALGLTFFVIGGLLIEGALDMNPEKAAGIGGALQALAKRQHGPWLLGAASLGFLTYGLHCVWMGRFRQLQSSTAESNAQ